MSDMPHTTRAVDPATMSGIPAPGGPTIIPAMSPHQDGGAGETVDFLRRLAEKINDDPRQLGGCQASALEDAADLIDQLTRQREELLARNDRLLVVSAKAVDGFRERLALSERAREELRTIVDAACAFHDTRTTEPWHSMKMLESAADLSNAVHRYRATAAPSTPGEETER